MTKVPFTLQYSSVKASNSSKSYLIKVKMPLSIQFFRDAEAEALHVQRCQLDRATLLACAVKRLREEQAGESASGQKPSA